MTTKNSIGKKYIQADFNYILNTARQAKDQAENLRSKIGELKDAVFTLDEFEIVCLDTIKELTGKDLHNFAMDNNYGRSE